MSSTLRIGMGDSYGIYITVLASDDFDSALPTGAILEVTKPNGTHVSWTASLDNQSPTSVRAYYVLSPDGLDLDEDGTWRVWVQFTVAGKTPGPSTVPGSFTVLAADQL